VHDFNDSTNGDNGLGHDSKHSFDNLSVALADIAAHALRDSGKFAAVDRIPGKYHPDVRQNKPYDLVVAGEIQRFATGNTPYWTVFINPISIPCLLAIPTCYVYNESQADVRIVAIDPRTQRTVTELVVKLAPPEETQWSSPWLAGYKYTVNGARLAQMFGSEFGGQFKSRFDKEIAAAMGAGGSEKRQETANTPAPAPNPGGEKRGITASPQPTAYALVVGIGRYRDASAAEGARWDAEQFEQVLKSTLGLKDEHIRIALDDRATKGDIEKHLGWLQSSVSAGGRVYFYFAGHGAPDPGSGVSYLLPYDGDPQAVDRTALKLSTVIEALQATHAKDVLAVVDSCFSGAGGRSVLPKGARPLVRVKPASATPRLAVFTASEGQEIAGPVPGASGGLFTHFVVEGLTTGQADGDGDGQLTLKELHEWVKPRVLREARKADRSQTPTVIVGSDIGSAGNFAVAWGLSGR
jgi:hypothetical protein